MEGHDKTRMNAMREGAVLSEAQLLQTIFVNQAVAEKERENQSKKIDEICERLERIEKVYERGRGAVWALGVIFSIVATIIWFREEVASILSRFGAWMGAKK